MHYNVHYEYIHKGYKEKCYQKYFLQIQTLPDCGSNW